MSHASWELGPWAALTSGAPAALGELAGTIEVAPRLAELQGCEAALLAPSTLHLFGDLLAAGARRGVICLDGAAYPIARWGAERAAARGARVVRFPHYDAGALRQLLRRLQATQPRIVINGFCPHCGRAAPLAEMLTAIRPWGGWLIVDDTQALGILGARGGGSLRWHGLQGPDIILVSSLAKAFGVPVAVVAGGRAVVDWIERTSETRVHCSPPSAAVVHAAELALRINERQGDRLRAYLLNLVRRFRRRIGDAGLTATGGLFPVQTLAGSAGNAVSLHARLLRRGIRTVLLGGTCHDDKPRIALVFTARHRPGDIDRVAAALVSEIGPTPKRGRLVHKFATSTLRRMT
jgi:8-amino-7-oxononanoate synthase